MKLMEIFNLQYLIRPILFLAVSSVFLTGCGDFTNESSAPANHMQAAPTSTGPKFGGRRADYLITKSNNAYVVTDRSGNSITVNSAATQIQFDDVSVNLLIAEQAKTISTNQLRSLVELYVAFFNRVPDADGLAYWISRIKAGMSFDAIALSFYSGALQYSAQTGYSAAMTNEDFVRVIYKNVLGRSGATAPPDKDVQYWADDLKNGGSKANLVSVMLFAAHSFANDPTWGWVPKLLDNKIAVGLSFAVESGLNFITPEESISRGMAIAAAVSADSISLAQSLIPGAEISGGSNTVPADASTYTLTLNIPELLKLVYNGSELKGTTSVLVKSGSAPVFDVTVHPSFSFANTVGMTYSNGKLSLTAPMTADKAILIAKPSLANPTQPILYSASYDRSAMFRDELGKTSMRIEAFAAVSENYKVVLTYTGIDAVSKQEVTRELALLDNGAGADRVAGDFHFAGSLKTDLLPLYEYMGIAAYDAKIRVLDQSGNEVGSAGQVKTGMSMVLVDRQNSFSITKLADDVYASPSVVNVIVPGNALRFNPDFIHSSDSPAAMQRVLAFYPDVFDHASFFYAGEVGPVAGSEYSLRLKNNVTGIGDYSRAYYPIGAKYGSNVLDSVSELTGGTTGPYMHEFTHRFGFFLNDSALFMSENEGCQCHPDLYNQLIWDPISAGGGLGIIQQPNGDWALTPFHGDMQYQHSDIMLYLMGLIAPSELPPQPWVVDASGKLAQGQIIPASKVKTVTAADIEAVYGKRSPAYGVAPNTFRDVFVLISAGRPALPEEMLAVEMQAKFYASQGSKSPNILRAGWQNGLAFYDSTKGKGRLVTELPARK